MTATKTITLTGRRPVKIRKDEWPVLAMKKNNVKPTQHQMCQAASRLVSKMWETFEKMQRTDHPLSCAELKSLAANPHTSIAWNMILDAALDYNAKHGLD